MATILIVPKIEHQISGALFLILWGVIIGGAIAVIVRLAIKRRNSR
jgi:CHASE1-domain containing sensor protein